MTDLDTTLHVDTAALRGTASWLRQRLGGGLESAVDALLYARADRGAWSGPASDAFRARMSSLVGPASAVADAAGAAAAALDRLADASQRATGSIAEIRATAAGAGLTTTPGGIARPPAAPAPSRPRVPSDPAAARRYAAAVLEHQQASRRVEAFVVASAAVADVRAELAEALDDLERTAAGVRTLSVPAIDFAVGAVIGGTVGLGVTAMRGQARFLLDAADTVEARTRLPGSSRFPQQFYRDVDDAAHLRVQSQGAADDAARLARAGRVGGVIASTLLTGVSISSDIHAGESAEQAWASNLGGLGASVAAGAGVGMFLGSFAPGIGNVAGAVIGAAVGGLVGIFTSGVIDGLYEENGDVAAALATGIGDLRESAEAVGDVVVGGGRAIGVAVSGLGHGLSDAWESVFG